MLRRNDPHVVVSGGVALAKEDVMGERWRGIHLSAPSRLEVVDAGRLPVADGSLDFIFSSHVFEHLANPIGHLEHWFRKLRAGGRVLCVIPDLMGTKDALQKPSCMDEWLGEYRQACWTPTPAHYARYFRQSPQSETADVRVRESRVHVFRHRVDPQQQGLPLRRAQGLTAADFPAAVRADVPLCRHLGNAVARTRQCRQNGRNRQAD